MASSISLRTMSYRETMEAVDSARISAQDVSREQWLADRVWRIGGSQAAAACGICPYTSRFTLYHQLRGTPLDVVETEPMRVGKRYEAALLDDYEDRSGRSVRHWPQTISVVHPDIPWMSCTPDALQWCDRRQSAGLGQCKWVGERMAHQWPESDDEPGKLQSIPDHVMCQVQHEMTVCGSDWTTVVVMIGGQKLLWLDVEYDAELAAQITRAEEQLLDDVKHGREPQADGSESTAAMIRALYPRDNGTTITLGPEWQALAARLDADKEAASELAERIAGYETQLKAAIGEATRAEIGDVAYTYKQQTRRSYTVAEATFRALRKVKGRGK